MRWKPKLPKLPPLPPPVDFLWMLVRKTVEKWIADDSFTMAAALSYYAIFSLAPVLVIAVAIAGFVIGSKNAEWGIAEQLHQLMGDQGAAVVQTLIAGAHQEPEHSAMALLVGLGVLFFGASGVFVQLQRSLNQIWGVPAAHSSGFLNMVRLRFLSFAMVIGLGLILLVTLIVGAVLTLAGDYFVQDHNLWRVFHIVSAHGTSLTLFTVLFTLVFKILPDVELGWRHVWIGGAVSAVLFDVGRRAIGLYLGHSKTALAFGAAGSLAVLLAWIFYGALILFLGAEFTCVYTRETRKRKHLQPDPPHRRKLKPKAYQPRT